MNFLEVQGDFACFTNPLMKADRMTYPVITPSAAEGILRSIYWHPGVDYKINRIFVMEPVKTAVITRAEIADKLKFDPDHPYYVVDEGENRQLRSDTVLVDPHYVIDYDFYFNEKFAALTEENGVDPQGKVAGILERRIRGGKCYHRPFFGMREYSVEFKEWDVRKGLPKTVEWTEDLGMMLYGLDYTDKTAPSPVMFKAKVENGVLDLRGVDTHGIGGEEVA